MAVYFHNNHQFHHYNLQNVPSHKNNETKQLLANTPEFLCQEHIHAQIWH